MAIVYDDDDYGRSAATELRRLAEGRELCVPVFESVPLDVSSAAFQTRAASIEEQVLKNTRYATGSPLHSLYNPWESLSSPPPLFLFCFYFVLASEALSLFRSE